MFIIDTPNTFQIGDTIACQINGESSRITWKDADTLVIEPDDPRPILHTRIDGKVRVFMCGEAWTEGCVIKTFPEGGFIVSSFPFKPNG